MFIGPGPGFKNKIWHNTRIHIFVIFPFAFEQKQGPIL